MKTRLASALILACSAPLLLADDQTKVPPSHPHSRSAAPVAATDAPQPGPNVARRPTALPANPNARAVSPTGRPIFPNGRPNDQTLAGTRSTLNRPVVPNGSGNNRTPVGVANVHPGHGTRIPARSGNELSFAQARSQCGHDRHDRDWWRHHRCPVVFYGGGYWFWNSGWWFPAWGYDSFYSNYVYDGPIYGFGQLGPGDVTAQVQEALAQQGYYYGAIDGVLGPETRDAILRFQIDRGLANTAAIDEPTLDSLGLT